MEKRKDGMRMKKYIGTKMVEAEKAFKIGDVIYSNENNEIDAYMLADGEVAQMGYKVRYPDGYESFSPKAVFEKAYLPLEVNKKLKTDAPSIRQKMVDDFISHYETKTLGNKTTVVRAVLVNGFEIVESSSCVSEENYDESMGYKICVKKIKEKVWYLLGFLLQTAVHGIDWRAVEVDFVPEVFVEKARDLEAEYAEQVEQERKMEDPEARQAAHEQDDAESQVPTGLMDTVSMMDMDSEDFKERLAKNDGRVVIRFVEDEDGNMSGHVNGEADKVLTLLEEIFVRSAKNALEAMNTDIFEKRIFISTATNNLERKLKEALNIK